MIRKREREKADFTVNSKLASLLRYVTWLDFNGYTYNLKLFEVNNFE